MNTPTHLLVSAALLTQKDAPRANAAVIAGAVVPDLSIYILFVWARLIAGISEHALWRDVYWQEPWQTLSAVSNSVPLFAALALLGRALGQPLLLLFSFSALIHLALDFPFHSLDAHQHFWPFTDWRFHSPFSYWDSRHHGDIVRVIEIGLGILCAVLLWTRFQATWVRALLAFALVLYVAVPAYFIFSLR